MTSSLLEMTQEVRDVSVTELQQFRTCRRRWLLETIENLVPDEPQMALEFGEGMHSALESYYLHKAAGGSGAPIDSAQETLEQWYREQSAEFEDNEANKDILDDIHRHYLLGRGMLDNYVSFDSTSRIQPGHVISVEGHGMDLFENTRPKEYPPEADVVVHESGRLMAPIVNPETKEPNNAYLTARIDLLVERKTPKKGLWVWDHKTTSRMPNDRGLDFDDQVTGYCYVIYRMTGKIPRGVVFNFLVKSEPLAPRVGVRGGLSAAKNQRTTPDLYRQALKEHDLLYPDGAIKTTKHSECMEGLLATGWDRFFMRFEPVRNEAEILNYERRLWAQHMDMVYALEQDVLYPDISRYKCEFCSVRPICQAMEDGSDQNSALDRFVVGPDRKER